MTTKTLMKLALGLGLAAFLAGCAAEPVAECEPGVGGISEMGTVTPPGC
ncbi:MAG: hypothetical protein JXJ18_09800 [Rhodobacteraceae bacterium]|nr:hypothetical protein [Paracoccaceae bacterium]